MPETPALCITVDGVGTVALPLLPQQAAELAAVAERAPYGRGPDTLVDTEVAFAAFYADCWHEVRPITAGCRLALVYNLVRSSHVTCRCPHCSSSPTSWRTRSASSGC